jgi:hypothetical protein
LPYAKDQLPGGGGGGGMCPSSPPESALMVTVVLLAVEWLPWGHANAMKSAIKMLNIFFKI